MTEMATNNNASQREEGVSSPISHEVIRWHLSGQDDVGAFLKTCRDMSIPATLERSRSGNGGHVWFFFEEVIPANLARALGSSILTATIYRTRKPIGVAGARTLCCKKTAISF